MFEDGERPDMLSYETKVEMVVDVRVDRPFPIGRVRSLGNSQRFSRRQGNGSLVETIVYCWTEHNEPVGNV